MTMRHFTRNLLSVCTLTELQVAPHQQPYDSSQMIRVPCQEVCDVLSRALLKLGFTPERARLCAQLFADTSRDGVYSHGLDRFPRFVRGIRKGLVDIHAQPELVFNHGALERWSAGMGTAVRAI